MVRAILDEGNTVDNIYVIKLVFKIKDRRLRNSRFEDEWPISDGC